MSPRQLNAGGAFDIDLTTNVGAMVLGANLDALGDTITLDSAATINQTAGTISASDLAVIAVGSATLTQAGNDLSASTIAASISGTGDFAYNDANDLTIGTVGTVTGITTFDGTISVTTAAGNLTVADVVTAGGANDVLLDATGDLVIDATVSAAGDAVLLLASGTLDVSGGSADIVAADLGISADSVTGTLPGDVDNLAADITGTGNFAFSDDNALTVTTVSISGTTVTGITTFDGTVTVESGSCGDG